MNFTHENIHVNQLQQSIVDCEVVLTPNSRMAQSVSQHIQSQSLMDSSVQCVALPDIRSYEQFCDAEYRHQRLLGDCDALRILTNSQDLFLWEQVIDEAKNTPVLMLPGAAASMAQKAYGLMSEWQLSVTSLKSAFLNSDVEAFIGWCEVYEKHLKSRQCLPKTLIPRELVEALSQGGRRYQKIALLGFQTLSPVQQSLFDAIANSHSLLQLATTVNSVSVSAAVDARQEISLAADWAASFQKAIDKNKVSEDVAPARIAVVVPDLSARRAEVERVFCERFDRDALRVGGITSNSKFNVSAGERLSETAPVMALLLLLQQSLSTLTRDDCVALCMSPYVTLGQNHSTATAADNGSTVSDAAARRTQVERLFDAGLREFTLEQLQRLVRWGSHCDDVSEWEGMLASIVAWKQQQLPRWRDRQVHHRSDQTNKGGESVQLSASSWLMRFREVASLWGWPGQRVQNTHEYQQLQTLEAALLEYAEYDGIAGEMTVFQALELLRKHLGSAVYHPQTVGSPSIEVLGLLEASGQCFDAIWLCGMSERQWPPTIQANPLLPLTLQRELAMPSASLERELAYSAGVTAQFMCSASQVHISFPVTIDEVECRISALFAYALKKHSNTWLESNVDVWKQALLAPAKTMSSINAIDSVETKVFEYLRDEHGEKMPEGRTMPGVAMVRDQSRCAFKAYVRHRLGVSALADYSEGVSAAERGIILHRMLERFWRECPDQSSLQQMSEAVLLEKMATYADDGLHILRRYRFEPLPDRIASLERDRAIELALAWLRLELERQHFSVVATEQEIEWQFGGLNWRMRLDRMDRLPDGSVMLVDYKSGRSALSNWFDERLTEPQLPLYALAVQKQSQESVSAIVYAQLRAGELQWKGVANNKELVPGVIELSEVRGSELDKWPLQLTRWEELLADTVNAIRNGDAMVNPVSPSECAYCELRAVCRIDQPGEGISVQLNDETEEG